MKKAYLQETLKQLETLLQINSPSGFTSEAAAYCMQQFESFGYQPVLTQKGGVLVNLGGTETDNGLVLGAHIDTLGAMVNEIKENGALRISPIGGLQANNIETETVTVHTRSGKIYDGTVQLVDASVHVNGEYSKTARTFDSVEVVLDEKVTSADDTRARGVSVGDCVAIAPRYVLTQSGYIKSRFLDDKLSAAILLAYAKALKEEHKAPRRATYIYFTVFEEVGHGGAASIPAGVTEMLSVDMGCVGKGLACTETMVSICAMDSRGPCNQEVVNGLVKAAQTVKVSYALDVYPHYGSDADVALVAGYDLRHGVVGAGVYASHGYERSHVEGLAATFDLLQAYIKTEMR
ncbi:MAG: M42 family metallopeptidase [Ruthenibacterium sp.]